MTKVVVDLTKSEIYPGPTRYPVGAVIQYIWYRPDYKDLSLNPITSLFLTLSDNTQVIYLIRIIEIDEHIFEFEVLDCE